MSTQIISMRPKVEIDPKSTPLLPTKASCCGVEVTEPSHYSSIDEAIREETTSVPEGFAHFAEVGYGGASSGTMSIPKIAENAPRIAEQLVAIVAEVYAH